MDKRQQMFWVSVGAALVVCSFFVMERAFNRRSCAETHSVIVMDPAYIRN